MIQKIHSPKNIQIIGNEIALLWHDDREDYFNMEILRACSPSAENMGEVDILGNIHGGQVNKEFPGVTVLDWEIVGSYAIRFVFSDGHKTGLYSYKFLQKLSDAVSENNNS